MNAINSSIISTIGNTPLVRLNKLDTNGAKLFAKIEARNPGGSVKDRIAKYMLEDAEQGGKLRAGMKIVEPTSGNTGIGLAVVAAAKGYKLLLVMPETMSIERRRILAALGAELVLTTGTEANMAGAMRKAREIAAEAPGEYFMPNQFENPANVRAHHDTTAVEIFQALMLHEKLEKVFEADADSLHPHDVKTFESRLDYCSPDMALKLDAFVAGVGTGGTISGVGQRIRARIGKDTLIVAVEPAESPVLSGGLPGKHGIQGIGAGFVPKILDCSVIDRIEKVSTQEAAAAQEMLAKKEGIFAGISSGAALHAALIVARELGSGKIVVVVLPDTGERYLSLSP